MFAWKIAWFQVRIGPLSNKKPVKDLSGDTVMNETSVAQLLEKSATGPHETGIKLSEPEAALCMSRIEKHGQDYKVREGKDDLEIPVIFMKTIS